MKHIFHEFDWDANHRIRVVHDDGVTDETSKWYGYRDIAVLDLRTVRYTAYTDYFGEKVEVCLSPTTVESAVVVSVCRECGAVHEDFSDGMIKPPCEHMREKLAHLQRTLESARQLAEVKHA